MDAAISRNKKNHRSWHTRGNGLGADWFFAALCAIGAASMPGDEERRAAGA